MNKAMGLAVAVVAVGLGTCAALACSSSKTDDDAACIASAGGPTCNSCLQTHCGSQLSSFENGCSDFVSCVCPGGMYSANLVLQCESKANESSCTGPAGSFEQCEGQSCASECGVVVSGGFEDGGAD